MLIKEIMEKDLENCYAAMRQDKELRELEGKFSDLLDEAEDIKFELDNVWGQYTARCIRVAFLQGLKEFYKLCLILRDEDTQEILQKYIDNDEMQTK